MSNTVETTEELQQRALILLQEATTRAPERAELGIIVSDSSVTPSPQMLALWFENQNQVSDFVMHCAPFSYGTFQNTDELPSDFIELADLITRNGVTPDSKLGLLSLNSSLLEWASIVWVGTFRELAAGQTKIEQYVITMFRSNNDTSPIKNEELPHFKEFLVSELPNI